MSVIASTIQRLHRNGEFETLFLYVAKQDKKKVLDELIKWGMFQEFKSVIQYGFNVICIDSWTYENEQSFIYQDHEYQYEITMRNCDIIGIGYSPK